MTEKVETREYIVILTCTCQRLFDIALSVFRWQSRYRHTDVRALPETRELVFDYPMPFRYCNSFTTYIYYNSTVIELKVNEHSRVHFIHHNS